MSFLLWRRQGFSFGLRGEINCNWISVIYLLLPLSSDRSEWWYTTCEINLNSSSKTSLDQRMNSTAILFCHYSPIDLMLNYSTKRYNEPVKLNRTFKMLLTELLNNVFEKIKLLNSWIPVIVKILFTVEFQSCFLWICCYKQVYHVFNSKSDVSL